jgi:hypothetical protein
MTTEERAAASRAPLPATGAVDIAIGQPIQATGTEWTAAVGLQRTARDAVLDLAGEPDVE